MQNRGLIKFFAIIFALVCVYQLSFTFVASGIEKDAKAFAKGDSKKELAYLDSIGKVEVYPVLGYTFNEVRQKQLNKGLDLEGGINVILQISVKDVLKGLANDSKNAAFNKALLNKISEPISGNTGVFVLSVNALGAKPAQQDPLLYKEETLQRLRNVMFRTNVALRKAASIKDNRSKVY